jgi:anti-sigma factor (TIGR02949 family)
MQCRSLLARLSEYLDGEVPPDLCAEVRAHLETCRGCADLARTLRRTMDLCRGLPHRPLPAALRERLRRQLDLPAKG